MMTRDEIIKEYEAAVAAHAAAAAAEIKGAAKSYELFKAGLSALRPVSREQVEKVFPGCEKCRNQANWPSWIEKGFVYCPKCGTPLTSWAWEKQMKRLEALKDGSTTDKN